MELEDLVSLNEAAATLEMAAVTLRAQAAAGRLRAVRVGGTWITTKQEVERYGLENRGNLGRPRGNPIQVDLLRWDPPHIAPEPFIRVIGFSDTPGAQLDALRAVVHELTDAGDVQTMNEIMRAVRADPRTKDLVLISGEVPPWIGIGRVIPTPAQLGIREGD